MVIFRAVTVSMPHIFGTVLHLDNACIAGTQEGDALYLLAVPFMEIDFIDSSCEANKTSFYQFVF